VEQVRRRRAEGDGRGEHVDALVHAVGAHGLGTEDPPGRPVGDRLDGQLPSPEVGGPVGGGGADGHHVEALPLGLALGEPGVPDGDVEDADDPGAEDAAVPQRAPRDRVARHPARLVGRRAEGAPQGRAGDDRDVLGHVTHRPHVGDGGAHRVVHRDRARGSEFHAELLRQVHDRAHPHRHDDDVGRNGLVPKPHPGDRLATLDGGDLGAQPHVHAVTPQLLLDKRGHVRVERGHHLRELLDERDRDPASHELLGHLQSDEAGTDDDGAAHRPPVQPSPDRLGVPDGAHREDAVRLDARQRRHDGAGAGGEHEHVPVVGGLLPRVEVHHPQLAALDRAHLVAGAHLDAPLREPLRTAGVEDGGVVHLAADEVRDAAARVGDVAVTFVDDHLRLGVVAVRLGTHGGPGGDGADDDDAPGAAARAGSAAHVPPIRRSPERQSTGRAACACCRACWASRARGRGTPPRRCRASGASRRRRRAAPPGRR